MVSIADEDEADYVLSLIKTQYNSQSWIGLKIDPVTCKCFVFLFST
jgi:hypothetical protein